MLHSFRRAARSDCVGGPASDPRPGTGRLAVLAAGTFAVGTDAFVIAGVLPEVSRSLGVSVGAAGQLVTVFAVAYALASPLLATVTGSWPRRRVLLGALGLFVAGNLATAAAPAYALVLAARVVTAAGAAMVTPTAGVTAAALVPAGRRARAIAVVTFGLTASTALGAPLGTAVAAEFGWRATMVGVAAMGLAAAAAIAVFLPDVAIPPAVSLRRRLAPVADARVAGLLATTLLASIGNYLIYTYAAVVFAAATGGRGTLLAVLLAVFGLAATGGNLAAGAAADRAGPRAVVATACTTLVVICATVAIGTASLAVAAVLIAVFGLAAFAITTPQQRRLIDLRPDDASLLVSLNAAFIYLAVAASGGLGAAVISSAGAGWIGPAAAAFAAAALATSELAHRLSRPAG